jgi:hypothetical protein
MLTKALLKKPAHGTLHFEERGRRWRARRNGMSKSWSEHIHGMSAKARALSWLQRSKTDGNLKVRKLASSKHQRHNAALVVKPPWTDLILDRKKTWEIRNSATNIRGFVKIAESGTGKLVGQARIADCIKVQLSEFPKYVKKHRVANFKEVLNYRSIYAWVIKDAVRYVNPPAYEHPQGAIIWVRL